MDYPPCDSSTVTERPTTPIRVKNCHITYSDFSERVNSYFLLCFLPATRHELLGLRDKTLFKHGEFYEIVCDDGRL